MKFNLRVVITLSSNTYNNVFSLRCDNITKKLYCIFSVDEEYNYYLSNAPESAANEAMAQSRFVIIIFLYKQFFSQANLRK